ncbi:tumor necrosis factor (ligand) superfamily, member 10 like 4 isoform X2 [Amia ocellicauda]|uniref:tumor necrosis factor (ligand) superfamily, member 10 like 4 isoform X2 n=1 Tax=Amia ocellicauda TaxID=2972642 RepID=UPI0034649E2D
MTSETQIHQTCYRQLEDNTLVARQERTCNWNGFVLVLSFLLGAEVIGTCFLVYDLAKELDQTRDIVRLGEYPVHCLQYLVDTEVQENTSYSSGDPASCDKWIIEMKNTMNKQLISDVRNALYREMTAHNVSLSLYNKPAIHLGPEQGWKQFPKWLKQDRKGSPMRTIVGDTVRWDNLNGVAMQQSMMGYSQDGEIVVPRDGLYFVYSQVYFRSGSLVHQEQTQPFLHIIYRKTSYQEPILLTKAAVTQCWNTGLEFDLFSSHQGALFQLQQDDRLLLKVHDIHHVHLEEDSTYFGAFMVH